MKLNQLKAGAILSYIGLLVSNIVVILYTSIMLRLIESSKITFNFQLLIIE